MHGIFTNPVHEKTKTNENDKPYYIMNKMVGGEGIEPSCLD